MTAEERRVSVVRLRAGRRARWHRVASSTDLHHVTLCGATLPRAWCLDSSDDQYDCEQCAAVVRRLIRAANDRRAERAKEQP